MNTENKELKEFLSESITLLEEQQCNIGLNKEKLNLLDQLNSLVKNLALSDVSQQSKLSFLEGYEIKVFESEYIDKPQLLLPKGLVKKDCG